MSSSLVNLKLEPLESLLETADFAASILREIEVSKRLGVDSLAGKAIEAASKLIAASALVRDSDPRFIEKETRIRVLKALALDESAWKAGSMHAYGALCHVEIPAETIPDGIVIIERLNPVNGFNCKEYQATYLPETFTDKRGRKRIPLEPTPYTGHLEGLRQYQETFELHCFVITHNGDTVQVRIPIKDFRPLRRQYKSIAIRGEWRIKDVRALEWQTYFRKQHKMWSSPDQPNSFIFAA